ncbi:MAG: glycosyltransferase family protein, partial [Bryobacterales bacterium]|nr:glycosyltransferase family protein [Bryobacterales bacterium]
RRPTLSSMHLYLLIRCYSCLTTTPYFSVITPAYNAAAYIGSALASVFAQAYDDFEVIVVNDGSPDTEQLEQAIAPFRSRITYIIQENRGAAGARNTAIRAATGKYLAFLDADDEWEPDCLRAHRDALRASDDPDVLYGDGHLFGSPEVEGKRMMACQPSEGEVTFESVVGGHCTVFESAAVASREMVQRVGLFEESLASAEDLDLWLRILKSGGRIAYHTNAVLRYRRHSDSLSADSVGLASNVVRVLQRSKALPLTQSEAALVDRRIAAVGASLEYYKGETALARGHWKLAAQHWTAANRVQRTARLWVMIGVLRVSPAAFSLMKQLRAHARRLLARARHVC